MYSIDLLTKALCIGDIQCICGRGVRWWRYLEHRILEELQYLMGWGVLATLGAFGLIITSISRDDESIS